jgi:hypothetical protein
VQECGKPTIYANVISVETAQSDFLIRFGIKKDRRRDVSEEDFDLNIILSPQTAKEFLSILANAVTQYEMLYGPIIRSSPH